MRAMFRALIRFFLFPGEWASDQLAVPRENNRQLVRMLVNYIFWGTVAAIGFLIWALQTPP